MYKVKCGTRAAITYQDELRVVSNQYLAGWRVECIFPVSPERKRENKTRRVCILIPIMSSPFAKKKRKNTEISTVTPPSWHHLLITITLQLLKHYHTHTAASAPH